MVEYRLLQMILKSILKPDMQVSMSIRRFSFFIKIL